MKRNLGKLGKKLTAGVLALVLAAGALTGCSGSKSTAETTTAEIETGSAAGDTAGTTEAPDQESEEEKASETVDEAATEKTTIHVVTKGTTRPYTYYNDNDELVGYDVDLVRALFEKLPQYDLVIEVAAAEALFAGLDTNKYQLAANDYGMTEERKEKYIYSLPIMTSTSLAVFNKNLDADIDLSQTLTLEDLAGLSWLGNAGTTIAANIEIYNEQNPDKAINLNYTESDNGIQLSEIESGKYDFMVLGKPMFYGFYQPQFNYDVQVADIEMSQEVSKGSSYFLIAKGNEQLAEDINAALKEAVEEGITKELGEQYLGGDFSPYSILEEE